MVRLKDCAFISGNPPISLPDLDALLLPSAPFRTDAVLSTVGVPWAALFTCSAVVACCIGCSAVVASFIGAVGFLV